MRFTARDSPFKSHNYCFLFFSNWISTLNFIRNFDLLFFCCLVVARFASLDNQQQSTIVDMREYERQQIIFWILMDILCPADNTSPIMLSMPQSCHLIVSLNWIERILNNFISSSSSLLLSVRKQHKMSTGDYSGCCCENLLAGNCKTISLVCMWAYGMVIYMQFSNIICCVCIYAISINFQPIFNLNFYYVVDDFVGCYS